MKVDDIIDKSRNENELNSNLIKYNKKIHGDKLVNDLIDMSTDDENLSAALVSLARKPRKVKEDESMLNEIFKGIGHLGYLAKPLDVIATPFTEAARAIPRAITELRGEEPQTPPIDTTKPYETLQLSDRFGLKNLITDISNAAGIRQGPTVNLSDSEIAQEYPRFAAAVEELSNPATLAALAGETLFGSRVPLADIPTDKLNKYVATKYIEAIQKEPKLMQSLKESGKFNDVVDFVSNDIGRYVRIRPGKREEVLDYIAGPLESTSNIGGYSRTTRDPSKGYVGQKAKELGYIEQRFPKDVYIDPVEVRASAMGNVDRNLLESQANTAQRIIGEEVPVLDYDPSALNRAKAADIFPAKRSELTEKIGTSVAEIKDMLARRRTTNPQELGSINTEIENISHLDKGTIEKYPELNKLVTERDALDDAFRGNLDVSMPGLSQEEAYRSMIQERNQRPSGFPTALRKRANQLIEGSKLTENAIDAGAQQAAGLALRKAADEAEQTVLGQMHGNDASMFNQLKREQELALNTKELLDRNRLVRGTGGNLVPVGDLSRGLIREGLSTLPEYGLPMIQRGVSTMNELIPPTVGPIPAAGEAAQIPYRAEEVSRVRREPQSYTEIASTINPQSLVANYQIPRNSQRLLQEKDIVMAKVVSELGPKGKQIADQLYGALETNPEQAAPLISQMSQVLPQIFEKDKYGRFDDKVPPMARPLAVDDLRKSNSSTIEKAKKISDLVSKGVLHD